MTTVLLVAVLLSSVAQTAPPAERVKLFLGPAPGIDGFVNTNTAFDDSYRDMEKAYSDAEKALGRAPDPRYPQPEPETFPSVLTLVTARDEADLILEVTSRPNRRDLQVLATLFVVGSEYKVDMDGRIGIGDFSYRSQAKGLLRQTAAWVEANRAALDKVRASRASKAPTP